MKIVVYGANRRVAVLQGEQFIDANWAYAKYLREVQGSNRPYANADAFVPANLQGFIEEGQSAIEKAQQAVEYQLTRSQDPLDAEGNRVLHSNMAVIKAPLPDGGNRIIMAGGNYADHLMGFAVNRMHQETTIEQVYQRGREAGMWGFWKLTKNVNDPWADMIYPAKTQRLDYEAEVVVIFNRSFHDVKADDAHNYYYGYTLQNDWSIRDDATPPRGLSFNLQKNFDTSSTLGPCIVVGEVPDAQNIDFQTTVDGEVRQRGNTKDMIYSFAEYLEYLSKDTTFHAGEMLSAGTCAGTAADSSEYDANNVANPRLFVKPGQTVEITSPQIGTIRNKVIDRPAGQ